MAGGKKTSNERNKFMVQTIISRLDKVHSVLKEVEDIKQSVVSMASTFDVEIKSHQEELIQARKEIDDLNKENEQLRRTCVQLESCNRCSVKVERTPLAEIQPVKEPACLAILDVDDSAILELAGPSSTSTDAFISTQDVQDQEHMEDLPVQGIKNEPLYGEYCADEQILGPDCMDPLSVHDIEDQDSEDIEVFQAAHTDESSSTELKPLNELLEDCEQAGPSSQMEGQTDPSTAVTVYCEVCQARFNCRNLLHEHWKCHWDPYGDRRLKCTLCAYTTDRLHHLRNHFRTHTKEKPYTCGLCHKSFAENGSLKRHMKMHTKEKPYTCQVCDRAFAESSNLKRHLKTHAKKKPLW